MPYLSSASTQSTNFPFVSPTVAPPASATRSGSDRSTRVQKFGGSSVADAVSIRRVANRILETRAEGHSVVAVVSAMGDTTDELIELARSVADGPSARELDLLLVSGEHVSAALLAIALADRGARARTFTGADTGLVTDDVHGMAHVVSVESGHIQASLDRGEIPIVAGFQGRSLQTGEITTLGRGGSDITAIALAAGLNADVCEIFTDVDGVFTADPRVVPTARKIDTIAADAMLELAACGAKVLHVRCVEYARRFGVTLHVRSSFTPGQGTLVVPEYADELPVDADADPEDGIVSGVEVERSTAKITLRGISDVSAATARLFEISATTGTPLDVVVERAPADDDGGTIALATPAASVQAILGELAASRSDIGFSSAHCDDRVGQLSLVGHGIRHDAGVSTRFFRVLAAARINIDFIASSETRISVVVAAEALDEAAAAVRGAFPAVAAARASVRLTGGRQDSAAPVRMAGLQAQHAR